MAFSDVYNRLPKESRQHSEGRDGKVVLTAQPARDFIRSLAEGFCKLSLVKTSFLHKGSKPIGNGERKARFIALLIRDFVENLL